MRRANRSEAEVRPAALVPGVACRDPCPLNDDHVGRPGAGRWLPESGLNARPPGNRRLSVPLDHLASIAYRDFSLRKHAVRASGPSRSSSDACSEARNSNPGFRDENPAS
jgi:hypothetical protein